MSEADTCVQTADDGDFSRFLTYIFLPLVHPTFHDTASTFKLIYSVHHNNYEQEYMDIIHLTVAFLHNETADF